MPVKPLTECAHLDHLKNQAHDLRKAREASDPPALQRVREFHPRFSDSSDSEISTAKFALSDALLVIAREHGFASWARLKKHLDGRKPFADRLKDRISDPEFSRALALMDAGDLNELRDLLMKHPDLVQRRVHFEGMNYFSHPHLIDFAAENPVRNGSLPSNIIQIVEALLDADSPFGELLSLVCSGRVTRERAVQVPLIRLLCARGDNPNPALLPALAHGEFAAADALVESGAKLTLPYACASGKLDLATRLFASATDAEKHQGLALAAQFGKTSCVEYLLKQGVDPNRYNPVGLHSHSTPLYQAAFAGHRETVEALLKWGARTDLKDTLWNGTARGWAEHGGHSEVVELLSPAKATGTSTASPA